MCPAWGPCAQLFFLQCSGSAQPVACDPDSPWDSRRKHRVAHTSTGPVRAWPALWCARGGLGVLKAAHICRCAACERPASLSRAIRPVPAAWQRPARPRASLRTPFSWGVWDAASSASGARPQATCSRLPPPLPTAPSLPRLVQPTLRPPTPNTHSAAIDTDTQPALAAPPEEAPRLARPAAAAGAHLQQP